MNIILITKMVKIFARAPVRIDFGGGTTDVYPFTNYGGAVLNAAIDKYVHGSILKLNDRTVLEYHADIPTSSGLGTSSAMNVVWLALTSNIRDKKKIAEMVYEVEKSTGIVGGKQDQYAAALGGINFLSFGKKVSVERLNLKKSFLNELEKKLFLLSPRP